LAILRCIIAGTGERAFVEVPTRDHYRDRGRRLDNRLGPSAERHVYRRGVDIAFTDGEIVHVGKDYSRPADRRFDGRDRLVLPGLVDIHAHPAHEPLYRRVREEHGLRNMYMTGLYERSQAFSAPDEEARAASAEFAYCELLRCGVTSLVDISPAWDGWIELFARSGLRGFAAPGFAAAHWRLDADFRLEYDWDESRARQGFRRCIGIDRHRGAASVRSALRRRLADADRHLRRRSAARRPPGGA
jgi:cytosine/adenosine deaminase-related metal-dependent hydrolase